MAGTETRGDPSGGGKVDEAKQQARQVAEQAKEQAQQATAQAGEQARGMLDQRTTQAGEAIATQAGDIRTVAQSLREQGKEGPAKLAEQAADRAERVGSYLTDSDGDRILSDVERIARDNPWAVIAGGIALGFAASRFLKASSQKRFASSPDFDRYRAPQLPRGAR
jgi:gas vesicle protein